MNDTKRFLVWLGVVLWCLCSLPFAHGQEDPVQLAGNVIIQKKLGASNRVTGAVGGFGGAVSGGVATTQETIGRETEGGSSATYAANYMYCYKLEETPHAGTVQSISWKLYDAAGTANVRLAIYTDDAGNGIPDAPVANSATPEIDISTKQVYTYTYSATKPTVTASQYWMCIWNDGNAGASNPTYYYSDTGSTEIHYKNISYSSTNPFPDWEGSAGGGTASRWFGECNFVNEY